MMRLVFFSLAFLLAAPAFAGYFLEEDAAENERKELNESLGFFAGGGASFAYYIGAFDVSLDGLAAYRFRERFGAFAEISAGISKQVHSAGGGVSVFIADDDFVSLGVGGVLFEKREDWKFSPRISLDYGHNMKPWPRAHFALQAKIRIAYLIGESLSREEIYVSKTANTTFSVGLALIFF